MQEERSNFPHFLEAGSFLASSGLGNDAACDFSKEIILPVLIVLTPPSQIVELKALPVPSAFLSLEDCETAGLMAQEVASKHIFTRSLFQNASLPSQLSLQHTEYISKAANVHERVRESIFDLIDRDGVTIVPPPSGLSTQMGQHFHPGLYAWSKQAQIAIDILICAMDMLPRECFLMRVGELPHWDEIFTWKRDHFPFLHFFHEEMSLATMIIICISHFDTFASWTSSEMQTLVSKALSMLSRIIIEAVTAIRGQDSQRSQHVTPFASHACHRSPSMCPIVSHVNASISDRRLRCSCTKDRCDIRTMMRLFATEFLDFMLRISSDDARRIITSSDLVGHKSHGRDTQQLFDRSFFGTVVLRSMSTWFVKISLGQNPSSLPGSAMQGQLDAESLEHSPEVLAPLGTKSCFYKDEIGILLGLTLRLIDTWELTGVWSALSLLAGILDGCSTNDIIMFYPFVKESLKRVSGLKNPLLVIITAKIYLRLSGALSNMGKADTVSLVTLLQGEGSAGLLPGLCGLTNRAQNTSYSGTLPDMILQEILVAMTFTKSHVIASVHLYLLLKMFRQNSLQSISDNFKQEVLKDQNLPSRASIYERFNRLQHSHLIQSLECNEQHSAFRYHKGQVLALIIRTVTQTDELPVLLLASDIVFLYCFDALVHNSEHATGTRNESHLDGSSASLNSHTISFVDSSVRAILQLAKIVERRLFEYEANNLSSSELFSATKKIYNLLKTCMAMIIFAYGSISFQVLDFIVDQDEEAFDFLDAFVEWS